MFFDRARNIVVYESKNPEQFLKVVQDAKPVNGSYVAAPATLYNLQVIKYLGYTTPAPMEGKYDWPGRYKPFEAQRATANFLTLNPRAFVLSDMGTGKTLSALWAADFVLGQYPRGQVRCLIVSPLSTLQRVWKDAIFHNFLGRRDAVVLHGSAAKRRELLAKPVDFYIINFDGLETIREELAARPDIRIAIVDEASAYRDRTTKRHKLARDLFARKDYLWMMTGTPTPNGPLDAYDMAKLVNNCFGESFTSYRDRVMARLTQFKWVPRSGAGAAARKLLSPSIRFAIEDCIDLPPITTQQRDVELSVEQAKAYKIMKKELQLEVKRGQITAVNEAALRTKLIQISCGAVYDSGHTAHGLDCKPRLMAIRKIIDQTNSKLIIFAPLTSVITMLSRELKDVSHAVITGATSQKIRNEAFRAFQEDDNPRLLLADPGTMAHGLDLYAATVVVWYAPTDRTELYLQANKRIHRPGQTQACTIVQLAATPIEREIFRRLENNESMQGVLLKMVREEGD